MSAVLAPSPTAAPLGAESTDLGGFGYRQELRREVGHFSSFAAGFSFVSILTTVFQLFALGFGFGGAAFFWTWPLVFAGQLLVALNFSHMAARFPISGAIYQWASRLAGKRIGWMAGWVMIIGQILTVATAAIALQSVLPSLWSGFQIVGGRGADAAVTSSTGATNAVLLGMLLLAVTTTVSSLGVRLMTLVNSTGVLLEIIGVAAVIAALLFHVHRGPSVLFTMTGAAPEQGLSGHVGAWLASGLMAAYVMVGFDSAGELAEETAAPRRTTPRTIINALLVSGLGGALLIGGALLAAPSLTDGNLATGGLPWVLTSVLGPVGGRILLADVAVAVFCCTLAVQTSGSRMVFSMARENALPFSATLAKVSKRTGTPVVASVVVGAGAALALAVNLHQSAIFTALSSICIAMLYLAYLCVTLPLLLARLRARRHGLREKDLLDEHGEPLFSLGRWGVAINVVAVAYQAVSLVNLVWPRQAIFDLTGKTWWLQWSAVVFIGLVVAVGALIYRVMAHRASTIELAPIHAHGHTEHALNVGA